MASVTITAKNQITLRKSLLEAIGARPGDKLSVDVRRGTELVMSLNKPKPLSWSDLAGIYKRPPDVAPLSIEEMNEVIARGWAGELDDND